MRQIEKGIFIIEVQPDDKCELCGKIDELRPYGPNKARICFDCGMKDENITQVQQNFTRLFEGDPE